jgi:hypothetical protein
MLSSVKKQEKFSIYTNAKYKKKTIQDAIQSKSTINLEILTTTKLKNKMIKIT